MTGRTNAGGGVQLPALTNPAAAGNIQSGYQAINGEGEIVTGTAAVKEAGKVQISFVNMFGNVLDIYFTSLVGTKHVTISNGDNTTISPITQSLIAVATSNRSEIQNPQNVDVLVDDNDVCVVEYTAGNGEFTVYTGY